MDRMMSHLKENIFPSDKGGWGVIIAVILFLSYFIFFKNYSLIFQYLVLAFFAFAVLGIIKEVKNRSLKRPKLTLKIILVFSIMVIFYILLFAAYRIPAFAGMTKIEVVEMIELLLFIIIINPLTISLIVLIIEPIFYFQKKRIIKRAAEKMRGLKKVKVIGITGSYGKTSTKEFLYSILSQKYKVVKTEGNNNTNIGVAYTVLNKVNDEYDYFICEMGAYKIGEIKEMCEIVKPKIGILTGINEQHIGLFGSQENIIKAKFELIEALPEDGLAIVNEKCKNQNGKLQFKVKNISYFTPSDMKNIKVYQEFAEFEYKNKKLKLNLLGKHYIENVLSAIITAERLGMSLEEIKNAVEKIRPNEFMMRKSEGLNNSIFIDDSYSANPDGVLAALDYLDEAYSGYKKIIVFPGIIELGKERDKIHKILYDRISEVCDIAYIINIQNSKFKIHYSNFVFEKDFGKVAEMLKNNLDKNTVVLFESRGAGAVMGKLKCKYQK